MAKSTEPFGGFDALVDMIANIGDGPKVKTEEIEEIETVDEEIEEVEDDEVAEEVEQPDDIEIPEPPKKPIKKPVEEVETEEIGDIEDLGEVEPEISSYFATSIAEKLGIELEKDSKFEKLDDVIDLMGEVIKANSKPAFANEEVEEYDQYVRNGGNLKAFYDQIYKDSVDPEKVDLEDEKDQKAVIEANLKLLGYKEERIKKVIARYEDAEVLKDEAEDALESLKDNQVKKAKTLLADQEKEKQAIEKQNKEFFDNVVGYVDNLKDIRGVEVDSKTKKEIVDYIFRVQPDGSTQFQKAYASDVVKNLIESAYFTKYGDTLLNKTTKKATDAALNKVREKLKASKGKRNTGSGSGLGKASPNFSSLSGLIIK